MAEDRETDNDQDWRRRLLTALENSERRRILRLLNESDKPLTTRQMAYVFDKTPAQMLYQLRVLVEYRAVRFLDANPQEPGSTTWESVVADDELVNTHLALREAEDNSAQRKAA